MRACVQAKLDGISTRLTYLNRKLKELVTRGDGTVGDDITPHAAHIRGIPVSVPWDGVVHVRGEIVLPLAEFREIWLPQGKANPRNTTSGLCKGRSSPADLATLQFVALEGYGAVREGMDGELATLVRLANAGFEVPAFLREVGSWEECAAAYAEYLERRDSLPYETDGVVVKLDRYDDQGSFPGVGNRPGHAVALKPPALAAVTKVLGVTWSMGLSGQFSPVANLEPAPLGGVTLRNVNLFNLDYLKAWVDRGFGVGATVEVVRSGDVIPYLNRVVSPPEACEMVRG